MKFKERDRVLSIRCKYKTSQTMKTYLNISSKVNDVLFTFFDRATDKDIVCFLSMTPQIIEPLVKGDFLCHAAS